MAARRPVEAAEDVHQRRLARARRAHDGDELAGLDDRLTPRSAWTLTSPTTKVRVTFSTLMTGGAARRLRACIASVRLRGAAAADWTGRPLAAAFGGDDLIARLEIAFDDLGEVVVVEAGHDGHRDRLDRRAAPRLAADRSSACRRRSAAAEGRRAYSAAPGPARAARRFFDRRRSASTRSCPASAPDRCCRRRPRRHRSRHSAPSAATGGPASRCLGTRAAERRRR